MAEQGPLGVAGAGLDAWTHKPWHGPTNPGVDPRTPGICLQNWEDEDVPALLAWLEEALCAFILELSNFDKYKKEVLSGSLDWSPMHTSVSSLPQSPPPKQASAIHTNKVAGPSLQARALPLTRLRGTERWQRT